MPYCNVCGQQYSFGAALCSRCGAALANVGAPSQPATSVQRGNVRIRRLWAGLIDLSIAVALFAVLFLGRRPMIALFLRRGLAVTVPHIYLLLKDAIEGKSPGKLLFGLVTYNERERKPAGVFDSIIRNWYLAIPFLRPTLLALLIGAQVLSRKRKRMGDEAADTIVISDFEYQQLR